MKINKILVLFVLTLSIIVVTGLSNNSYAGPGGPTDCSSCGDQGQCEGLCDSSVPEGCYWDGDSCEAGDPPPGKCTVSSNDISTNLICLCQNQTRRGKDTFKVIQCNNQAQIDDCNKRGGEVKQYINADDSANLFDFDCSETNCLDVCIND